MPINCVIIDNKKYLWDNKTYIKEEEALSKAANYKKDSFEVQLIQETDKFFLYTRRAIIANQSAQA